MSLASKSIILTILIAVSPAASTAAQMPEPAVTDPGVVPFYLGPSDEIEVSVWEEPALAATVVVRPDGKISLPLVGSVDVAGRTPEEVEAELKERYRSFLGEPIVVLIVRGINSAQVSILGEVRNPGRFPLQQRLSLLDAIAEAGGFTEFADLNNVVVIRNDQRIRVRVGDILDPKKNETLLMMQPGDTVFVR